MPDDLRTLGAQFTFPATHRSGEALLPVVYADPGMNGFYYRERMSDSVAAYVRADLHAAALEEIERLRRVCEEVRMIIGNGFQEMGETVNYAPSTIQEVCDRLESAAFAKEAS
jgi:hypothetical protein